MTDDNKGGGKAKKAGVKKPKAVHSVSEPGLYEKNADSQRGKTGKEYLSVREVAEQAGQSYGTVKRAIDCGCLTAYRIGRKFFIAQEAAAAYCQGSGKQPEGYTLQEIMEKLSLSYAFVSRLVRSGELKSRKVGRQYIVSEADFQDFMLKNRL